MYEGRPVDHLPAMPITMQFAADRLPARYIDYCIDPRTMAEGQIRVAEDFGLDYVNVMSDPACEAFDCGAAVSFFPGQPPAMDETNALLADRAALRGFRIPDPEAPGRMKARLQTLSLYRERVGDSLWVEGWVEGPCAEAADLRGINALMTDFYDDPPFICDLFGTIIDMELLFARAQVQAGADALGIGDAAASLVGPALYEEFVFPHEKRLVDGIHALGARVRLHICGNTRRLFPTMARLGCDHIDLDSPAPLDEARAAMGERVALCGNIDPVRVLRDGSPESVYAAIAECRRQAGDRYIVGAGCEAPRDTPPENFAAMVQFAKDHA
jgi:MtaA/CmuA family methyltransferase